MIMRGAHYSGDAHGSNQALRQNVFFHNRR